MTILDLSNWDFATFDATAFKAAGVTDVILGCQNEVQADAMAEGCITAGINLMATYAFLYFGISVLPEVAKAVRVALAHGIQWVALDVESTVPNERPGYTAAERVVDLRGAVAAVHAAGLSPFIYTGEWYWPANMANTSEFSTLPLWHSEYPADGHMVSTVAYGGWTAPHIHQYTSALPLCGKDRDANYVITPLEDDMTPIQTAMLQACYDALTGGMGNPKGLADITAWNANGNALLEGYVALQGRVATLEAAPPASAIPSHAHTLTGSTGGPA